MQNFPVKILYGFPGQGSQIPGMGQGIYTTDSKARELFDLANDILGFKISKIMFQGTAEELRETTIAQPAIFLYSVILAKCNMSFKPNMVAGHSLGEISAIVACNALSFDQGLKLIIKRAKAMQHACLATPSTMVAVLGLGDDIVEAVCSSVKDFVKPANYNCPGQIVISGTLEGVKKACEKLLAAGAKKIIPLQVSGGFHTTLMQSAACELQEFVNKLSFTRPICPIYQNLDALPTICPETIKEKLLKQIVSPVLWAETIRNAAADGATSFVECGPGNVLQGLVRKVDSSLSLSVL